MFKFFFYTHTIFGAIALVVGWTQFIKELQLNNPMLHRSIGKMYVLSVLISSVTSLYIACFAYGGLISSLGFICLAIAWFYSTYNAYSFARKRRIPEHKVMMYFSYAITLSAVTFRIYRPVMTIVLSNDVLAHQLSAWLCWIPNLVITYFCLVRRD